MNEPSACRIQADVIVVSSQRVLMPGQITIRHGRIVDVTDRVETTPDVRLNSHVLLPGLINSHTHLEFSDLAAPLAAGANFPEWIRNVLAARQHTDQSTDARQRAITSGIVESHRYGVAVVGDIVSIPWQPKALSDKVAAEPIAQSCEPTLDGAARALLLRHLAPSHSHPTVVAFIEQLGLTIERQQVLAQWRDELQAIPSDTWPARLLDLAISPHAPYSTPPELWESLTDIAVRNDQFMAMHVLESPAEREWLDSGSGPMAEMLTHFGRTGWRLPSDFMAQLCQRLSCAKSTLLVHGNYLNDAELDAVARYRERMSLVYCPRTHGHFGHQSYPFQKIEQRGLRWLLATDSRSTNPDLNLWQEARTALALHPSMRPSAAFAAITSAAADALAIAKDYGSLEVGKVAALNCLRVESPLKVSGDALFEYLFNEFLSPGFLFYREN